MKSLNPADYPTYNVGDEVTIRQWDDMESEFGLDEYGGIKVPKTFTEFMYYASKIYAAYQSLMESSPVPTPPPSVSFDDLLQGGA